MISPFVICNGVIRSGSTWSFNVCRMLAELRATRRGESFFSDFLDGTHIEKFLQAEVYFRHGTAVFKTHSSGPLALEWVRTGKAKAVCTFRDPRDCVASDIVFMKQGFAKAVERVSMSLRALESYRDFGRTLFVRYEDMMNDRAAQIQMIAAHLGVRVDQKDIERIDEETNISSSRKLCAQMGSLGNDAAPVIEGEHRRHAKTLLHDNHIGSGKMGRWKHDLTDAQGQDITRLYANFLLVMGYETQQSIQPFLNGGGISGQSPASDTSQQNSNQTWA